MALWIRYWIKVSNKFTRARNLTMHVDLHVLKIEDTQLSVAHPDLFEGLELVTTFGDVGLVKLVEVGELGHILLHIQLSSQCLSCDDQRRRSHLKLTISHIPQACRASFGSWQWPFAWIPPSDIGLHLHPSAALRPSQRCLPSPRPR